MLSYGIEQHGKCWAIVGLKNVDGNLEYETVWTSAEGASESAAKDKLVEFAEFSRNDAKKAYEKICKKCCD